MRSLPSIRGVASPDLGAVSSAAEPGGALRPSARDGRYLENGDGETFIPIGLNLCFPRFVVDPEEGMARVAGWMRDLAENGGNFMRLWLGHSFFDVEPRCAGEFDRAAFERIERVLDMAQGLGLRVKLTLDHFRDLAVRGAAESFAGAADFSRPQYSVARGGPAVDMDSFWRDPAPRAAYLRKLDLLAERFANHPAAVAWELWNEINACRGGGWRAWTEAMLPELRRRFPRALALQSLGSLSADYAVDPYRWLCGLRENDVAQVHRYLDTGSDWPVCREPMDVLLADAVRELRSWSQGKPVLLAEGGAVEANHAAPSALYAKDRDGVILHDVLFAPFFAGAAGPGQCWHWDFYVARHRLWWHFGRFARAIEGFDPVREKARPIFRETGRLRIYSLKGDKVSLIWIRSSESDWRTELRDGVEPALLRDETFVPPPELGVAVGATIYDPWRDVRLPETTPDNQALILPPFRRSLVLKLRHV